MAAAGSTSGVGAFSVEDAAAVTADVVTGEPTAVCADVKQRGRETTARDGGHVVEVSP